MLKLIVFDCDGVMFDSKKANKAYYNDLLAAFNFSQMSDEELTYVHMHNVNDSVNHIFRHYPEQDIELVHRLRMTINYSQYLQYMKIEPDLVDFLRYAQQQYQLAISTNRTNTMRPLLNKYALTDYFQIVVTAADVKNPKPAPDALHKILDYFNCSASQTIFIGDSHIDQLHSGSLGIPLIAFKNEALDADYHVNSFMEICSLPPFRN